MSRLQQRQSIPYSNIINKTAPPQRTVLLRLHFLLFVCAFALVRIQESLTKAKRFWSNF
jgi:hypothetical protein